MSQTATLGSRVLYWASQSSSVAEIRIKRSLTLGGVYALFETLEPLDEADEPIVTFDILDDAYYKVYTYIGTTEAEITSACTESLVVPDRHIIRRVRRLLGELREKIVITDKEIRLAYNDVIVDTVSDDLSKDYSIVVIEDTTNGEEIPIAIENTTIPTIVIPNAELLCISYATALAILNSMLSEHSRDAISMDSPAGRINTTVSPEAIRRLIESLERRYNEQVDRITVDSFGTVFIDITPITTGRGYAEEV